MEAAKQDMPSQATIAGVGIASDTKSGETKSGLRVDPHPAFKTRLIRRRHSIGIGGRDLSEQMKLLQKMTVNTSPGSGYRGLSRRSPPSSSASFSKRGPHSAPLRDGGGHKSKHNKLSPLSSLVGKKLYAALNEGLTRHHSSPMMTEDGAVFGPRSTFPMVQKRGISPGSSFSLQAAAARDPQVDQTQSLTDALSNGNLKQVAALVGTQVTQVADADGDTSSGSDREGEDRAPGSDPQLMYSPSDARDARQTLKIVSRGRRHFCNVALVRCDAQGSQQSTRH